MFLCHADRVASSFGPDATSVATNGTTTVILNEDGSWAGTAGLPKQLYNKLNGPPSAKPTYVALGSLDRYYIRFADGKSQYVGCDEMTAELNSAGQAVLGHPSMCNDAAIGYDAATATQLACWFDAKRARDFVTADLLRDQMRARGINPEKAAPPKRPTAVADSTALSVFGRPVGYDDTTTTQLESWFEAKQVRDFVTADRLREQMRARGIDPEKCPKREKREKAASPKPKRPIVVAAEPTAARRTVKTVAFGVGWDTYFIVYEDGWFKYGGSLPAGLVELAARRGVADLDCVALGSSGQWYMSSKNGKFWLGGVDSATEQAIRKPSGKITLVDFGAFDPNAERDMFFLRYRC